VTPAFVVPFVFTLSSSGAGILLQGTVVEIVTNSIVAALGVAALSVAISGWLRRRLTVIERGLIMVAAMGFLLYG